MRIGLVGRGPQAQRYLDPRNGGNMIVSQVPGRIKPSDYVAWLDTVDAVVVATHPRGHRSLAIGAAAQGKPVLVEKPLGMTWQCCDDVIRVCERMEVRLEVAHTHLWHEAFPRAPFASHASVSLSYSNHDRSYSPWLDWGPHILAMLEETGAPRTSFTFCQGERRSLRLDVEEADGVRFAYTGREAYNHTPMWHMMHAFAEGRTHDYDFQRRVYRALFDEEAKRNGEG